MLCFTAYFPTLFACQKAKINVFVCTFFTLNHYILSLFPFFLAFFCHCIFVVVICRQIHNWNANPFVNCHFVDGDVIFISVQDIYWHRFTHAYALTYMSLHTNIFKFMCVSHIHFSKCVHLPHFSLGCWFINAAIKIKKRSKWRW